MFSVGLNITPTKKGRQLLGEEKCTPREKSWLCDYAYEEMAPPYVGMGLRMVNPALIG